MMLNTASSHVGARVFSTFSRRLACTPHFSKRSSLHCAASASSAGDVTNHPFAGTSQVDIALASRRAIQLQAPVLKFPVVGVSFDNRQDNVKLLRPGQALLFVKQPDNPHDPNAVTVQTTAGVPLGYVPRDLTHHFLHERISGRVHGVTINSSGLHGARVHVRPSLPSLLLQQLPANLWRQGCADLEMLLGPQFAQLQEDVLTAAGYRCEVTGIGADTGAQLKVSPVWRLDATRRVAVLVRCIAVCKAIYDAERMLDPSHSRPALPTEGTEAGENVMRVAELLQDINFWQMRDVWSYLEHSMLAQDQLSDGGTAWLCELP